MNNQDSEAKQPTTESPEPFCSDGTSCYTKYSPREQVMVDALFYIATHPPDVISEFDMPVCQRAFEALKKVDNMSV